MIKNFLPTYIKQGSSKDYSVTTISLNDILEDNMEEVVTEDIKGATPDLSQDLSVGIFTKEGREGGHFTSTTNNNTLSDTNQQS